MKISTKGRYAIEAVLDLVLNSDAGLVRLVDIAKRRGISENYLEQIFIDLRKNRIITSVRGAKGGYLLARDASSVTCGEIIRAAEKKTSPVMCVAEGKEKHECGRYELCPARVLWEKIKLTIDSIADSVNVCELAEKYRQMSDSNDFEYVI